MFEFGYAVTFESTTLAPVTIRGTIRLEALFSMALACGLRLGEATGLRWADVDFDTGEIQVRVQLQRVRKPGTKVLLRTSGRGAS